MKKAIILLILCALTGHVVSQKIHPDSVKVNLKKAQTLFREGNKSDANAIYSVLMKEYPDNREAAQGWLVANMKRSPTGELDAILQLDSLNKIYPENTGIIFFRAFINAEYGKNEEALADLEKLILLQPDSADNWIMKGQIMFEMKKYQDACTAFEKATILNPKRPDVWGMKAAALIQNGKHDEALVSANKGVALNPGDPNAIYNRGCIYCLKGDKVNALADLRKAIELNPNLKQHAKTDEDFKSLWEDEEFKNITQ
jgi:tetratricopeptide (TPR) repeat protein